MTVKVKLDDKKLQELIKIARQSAKGWVVEDGVEYGVHQEFTSSGHPSLVPAFERHTKQLPEAIGEAIEKGVDLNDVLQVTAMNIQADWAADVNVDTGAYKNSIHARPA